MLLQVYKIGILTTSFNFLETYLRILWRLIVKIQKAKIQRNVFCNASKRLRKGEAGAESAVNQ